MTEVSIVGVDLAKQAFQLHAAARDGRLSSVASCRGRSSLT